MPLPCLVMIPGTLCDARLFAAQRRRLRGIARTVVVDPCRLDGLDRAAERLLAVLPERFSLAGFSLGGLWAIELLRRAPERIERIALVASNAEGAGDVARRRSAALARRWRAGGPQAAVAPLVPTYFHHLRERRRHAPLVHAMAAATPGRVARRQFAWAARRPAGHAVLAAATQPLLVIAGAQDRICRPALQARIAKAQPRARRVELARCGHFVPLERPAALATLLADWLHTYSPTGALP